MLAAVLLASLDSYAIPAPPFLVQLQNADGTTVAGRLLGDEHSAISLWVGARVSVKTARWPSLWYTPSELHGSATNSPTVILTRPQPFEV
jgi:hypothetical protein